MSEPIRKPGHAPESYDPKDVPEIVKLAAAQEQTEKLVDTFTDGKTAFEVFDRPETLWVGTLAWAADNDSEPDGDALLKKYQSLVYSHPQREFINPDWSAGISINYRHGRRAPWGMLFAVETWTANQDSRYDVFTQPAGLYLRMRKNDKEAKKLLGKKHYEMEDLYAYMAEAASRQGYRLADDNPIGIYYHDHQNGTGEYAIIPVEKAPESYDPKDVPEIVKLANEITINGGTAMQPVIKAAPATIQAKARNQVRVVELSPCKMVWSGISKDESDWAEGGLLWRFSNWFSERKSLLAVRDLLWYDTEQGGFAWGWAVDTIPDDTDGFPVMDFPGGLYATIVSVDGDMKDHDKQRATLLKWIEKSGCFVLDVGAGRYEAGHILVGTPLLKNAMGYHQMELYAPIKIKEDAQ